MKNWSVDTECIVVLENFEYQIHDHKANTKKLRLLEQLFAAGKKVIISTETHPLVITDLYHEEIKHAKLKDEDHAFAEDLEVWRHIFSSFIDVYKPLHDNFNVEDLWLKDNIIHRELRYGNYLLDIKPLIENELSNKKHKRESIILEIQNYAQSYYFSLWNSLSKEEFSTMTPRMPMLLLLHL
jgi:hypothetical protein